MTSPQRGQRRGRRPQRQKRSTVRGLWSPTPPLNDPDPIKPAADPTVLIDSLGPPPLRGHSSAAEHYLAAVVERAAAVATALAASAGLLADSEDE
jgi:hypothetical protein